jgi:hypothetical protein
MDVCSLIADEDDIFWRAVKATECLLRPMYFCVDVLRNDHAPLSMVVGCFVLLHRFYRSFAMRYADEANILSFLEDDGNYDAFLRASLRTVWLEVAGDSDNVSDQQQQQQQPQESIASMLLHLAYFLDPVVMSTDDELAEEGFVLSHLAPRVAAMEGVKYLGQAVGEDLTAHFTTYLLANDHSFGQSGGGGGSDAGGMIDSGSLDHPHSGGHDFRGGQAVHSQVAGSVLFGGSGSLDSAQANGVVSASAPSDTDVAAAHHREARIERLCNDSQVVCHPLKRWLETPDSSKLAQIAISLFRVPASPTAEKRMFQVCT